MAGWYNSNWQYRKKITIDNTKVSGSSNLTNFPVVINNIVLPREIGNANTGARSGTAISITHGITIKENDVIIAYIHANGSGNTITDNNGSYPFTDSLQENSADSSRYSIQYRVAGSSEPATYNWTTATSRAWSVIIRVFRNIDTTSVWDVAPSASTKNSGTGTTATAPSITVSSKSMGLILSLSDTSGQTYSNPTNGYASKVSHTNRSIVMYTRTWESSGATGTTQVTQNSNDWLIHQVSLKVKASSGDDDLRYTGSGGGVGKTNGGDILFTSDDGTTKLKHEIEKYVSTTGELVAWVKVPTLKYNTDTDLYMYYGYASASDQEDPTNVWDSNYEGVWHLEEDPSGSSPQMLDSTTNNHDGTSNGSMTSSDQVLGMIDGSLDFDGSNDYLDIGSAQSWPTSGITLQGWVKAETAHSGFPISLELTSGSGKGATLQVLSGQTFRFGLGNGSSWTELETNKTYDVGVFYHFVATWDGTTKKIFIDGVQDGNTQNMSGSISYNTGTSFIGIGWLTGGLFNGILDEIRVSKIARSSDWIVTEFNNQSDPPSFYTISTEEGSSSSSSSSSSSLSSSSSSATPGTVVWGHHTSVDEDYDENFTGNTTGWVISGTAGNDNETIDATSCGQICTFDPWYLGTMTAIIEIDKYQSGSGPTPTIEYRTATTRSGCLAASWNNYGTSFISLGWIQIRLVHKDPPALRVTSDGAYRITTDGSERVTE